MQKLLLFIILFVAVFFRAYSFPSNPPALDWDEVSMGYNAYSILKTGKDEFGNFLPLYFRSLDDNKLPLYTYITVGSIFIFGFNDFAVRFPSLLFGVATIVLLFFLTFELTKSRTVSFLTSLFIAILPWHVQFSRMALEANVALFFYTLGLLSFFYALKNKSYFFIISAVSFTLAMYGYLSMRIIVPLTTLLLLSFAWKSISFKDKYVKVAGIFVFIVVILLAKDMFLSGGHVRLSGTSVLNDYETFKQAEEEMLYDGTQKINLPRRFFHEIPLFTQGSLLIRGYLVHFSTDFLFFDRGQKYHHAPGVGLLYLWMIPFLPLGLYYLFKKYSKSTIILVVGLILIAPIPASITFDVPHATRVFMMSIPLTILVAIGVVGIFEDVKKKNIMLSIAGSAVLAMLIFTSAFYFFHQYNVHLPYERSSNWLYGRQELATYLMKEGSNYDKVVISPSLEWPYIFLLYYMKYDPKKYLAQGGTESGKWDAQKNKFENYEFHTFNFLRDLKEGNVLLAGKPEEFPSKVKAKYIIRYNNNENAIVVYEGDVIKNIIQKCVGRAEENTTRKSAEYCYKKGLPKECVPPPVDLRKIEKEVLEDCYMTSGK